jgi:hypothetical protein
LNESQTTQAALQNVQAEKPALNACPHLPGVAECPEEG